MQNYYDPGGYYDTEEGGGGMQRQEVGPTDNSKADVRASTTTTAGSGGMSTVEVQKGILLHYWVTHITTRGNKVTELPTRLRADKSCNTKE